jgi:hypothetical protein
VGPIVLPFSTLSGSAWPSQVWASSDTFFLWWRCLVQPLLDKFQRSSDQSLSLPSLVDSGRPIWLTPFHNARSSLSQA